MPGITARNLALPDGGHLRVVESGPASGRPLLLLHGWAVSSYLWRHNILPLAAAGYRVVSIDLPGHGLSYAPDAAGSYTLARFSAAVGQALDLLAIRCATIVAQSMGGKIAVQFALDAPGRVSQLLLFGPVGFGLLPPWSVLSPFIPALPGSVPSLLVPRRVVEFVQRRVHGKLGTFTERDVDEYWAPTQFPGIVRAQLQMLKEFDWAPWEKPALAALRTPTRLVFGTRDRTVRPVHATGLASALPQGALTWIEDGGHVVMEEVPERINALILEDLARDRRGEEPHRAHDAAPPR
ncbi:MAG: alpha/beta fold hydrolase [Gemmatimonadota bacterium]|nr:alpha/beta fold hydrolase [Gemmatimonadota bacterium]